MTRRFNNFVLTAALLAMAGSAAALEYKSVDPALAILYDGPSTKGTKKLFSLRRFTPVEVVASASAGFTKVREPDGAMGFVESKVLVDKRYVLVSVAKAQVRLDAQPDAALVFEAEKGLALELLEPAKDGWAKVKHADGAAGLVRVMQVWGL